MKEIAAYILCVLGGSSSPSVDQITAVITAAGGEIDEAKLTALVEELAGKDISELMTTGKDQLKACAGVASVGSAAPAAATSAVAAEAPKKEEKPKEEEVDALDGGMDMFGGGGGGGDY